MGWLCSLHEYFFERYYAINKGRLAWCGVAKYSISGLGTELGLIDEEKIYIKASGEGRSERSFFREKERSFGSGKRLAQAEHDIQFWVLLLAG
jgi:hypothetical protein